VFRCVVTCIATPLVEVEAANGVGLRSIGTPGLEPDGVCEKPRGTVCSRRLCDDTIVEFIDVGHSELSERKVKEFVQRVPVDGRTYRLEDFRDRNAKPQPVSR